MKKVFYITIALALLSSCSSETEQTEKPQETSGTGVREISAVPPTGARTAGTQYILEIFPDQVTRHSALSLIAKGFNLDDADIQWLVNGIPSPTSVTGSFHAAEVERGSTIQARALLGGKEIISGEIRVENARPRLSDVKLLPGNYQPGDALFVEASGSDIDGDHITMVYEWRVNGKSICEERQCVPSLKRGDVLTVKVTAFDDEYYSLPVVMKREIVNMPPFFERQKDARFEGRIFMSQVKAIDPDGDPLSYSLKHGPDGMAIDSSTGLITWEIPQGFQGIADASVVVSDGHNGTAQYDFKVTID